MDLIRTLTDAQMKSDLPEIKTGDTVKVSAKVVEGNRERIQVFEGTVMRLRGGGLGLNITVRRIASGVGVERTFKVHSPRIEKIEVVRHGVSNRAQLYFLRDRVGKQSSLRERRDSATDIAKNEVKAAAKKAIKDEADAVLAAAAAVVAAEEAAVAAAAATAAAAEEAAESTPLLVVVASDGVWDCWRYEIFAEHVLGLWRAPEASLPMLVASSVDLTIKKEIE